jgi:hypothetical protein
MWPVAARIALSALGFRLVSAFLALLVNIVLAAVYTLGLALFTTIHPLF